MSYGLCKALLKRYVRTVWCCCYLCTLGFFQRRNREIVAALLNALLPLPRPRALAKRVPFSLLVPTPLPVTILAPEQRSGNVSHLELLYLMQLVRKCNPYTLFELGTFDGRTTLNCAANTADTARIVTIDLPLGLPEGTQFPLEKDEVSLAADPGRATSRFLGTPYEAKVTQLRGDSGRFDFSPWEGSCDFVFVDASHHYEAVLNDSRVALRLLREGKGVVVWHDYDGWPGVTDALNTMMRQHPAFANLVHIEQTSLAVLDCTARRGD